MSKYETDEAYHRGVFHGFLWTIFIQCGVITMLALKWWMGE